MLETIAPQRLWEAAGISLMRHKLAGDLTPSYSLSGNLYLSRSGWLMLSVPNGLVRAMCSQLDENGVELPTHSDGSFEAHISVCSPQELESIGGPDKVTERNKAFHYSIGRLVTVEPEDWKGVETAWILVVHSPELQELRRSYGLSSLPHNNEYRFHITVGVRRRGVLGRGAATKVPASRP